MTTVINIWQVKEGQFCGVIKSELHISSLVLVAVICFAHFNFSTNIL